MLAILGGSLTVENGEKTGTKVMVKLPLKSPSKGVKNGKIEGW